MSFKSSGQGSVQQAGLVDGHALTRALTAAAKHIEANLFTGEAGRTTPLFESLVPKLGDLVLVNNIFMSIYFIGTLTAGLASSLPNYKESYIPTGPRLGTAAVQGCDWGRRFQKESIRESRYLQNAGSHRGLAEAYGYWLFDFLMVSKLLPVSIFESIVRGCKE